MKNKFFMFWLLFSVANIGLLGFNVFMNYKSYKAGLDTGIMVCEVQMEIIRKTFEDKWYSAFH